MDQVKKAIRDSADNLTDAAMHLGICRETLSRMVNGVSGCVNPYKFGAIETEGAVWPLCF